MHKTMTDNADLVEMYVMNEYGAYKLMWEALKPYARKALVVTADDARSMVGLLIEATTVAEHHDLSAGLDYAAIAAWLERQRIELACYDLSLCPECAEDSTDGVICGDCAMDTFTGCADPTTFEALEIGDELLFDTGELLPWSDADGQPISEVIPVSLYGKWLSVDGQPMIHAYTETDRPIVRPAHAFTVA